eukprot:m.115194 g.115194  ORF g.115194 m.115194 type:complete len:567 (-) comp19382_c1_seq2:26-1726(-)
MEFRVSKRLARLLPALGASEEEVLHMDWDVRLLILPQLFSLIDAPFGDTLRQLCEERRERRAEERLSLPRAQQRTAEEAFHSVLLRTVLQRAATLQPPLDMARLRDLHQRQDFFLLLQGLCQAAELAVKSSGGEAAPAQRSSHSGSASGRRSSTRAGAAPPDATAVATESTTATPAATAAAAAGAAGAAWREYDDRRTRVLQAQTERLRRQVAAQTAWVRAAERDMSALEAAAAAAAQQLRAALARKSGELDTSILQSTLTSLERVSRRMVSGANAPEDIPVDQVADLARNAFAAKEYSLLDVACGSVKHINMRRVAALETKLCRLYHDLCRTNCALPIASEALGTGGLDLAHALLPQLQLQEQLGALQAAVQDVGANLLQLSLLTPAVPLPKLGTADTQLPTAEALVDALGVSSRRRPDAVAKSSAFLQSVEHALRMRDVQLRVQEAELARLAATVQAQLVVSCDLTHRCEEELQALQDHAVESVRGPLSRVLRAFEAVRQSGADSQLRSFLTVAKEEAPALQAFVAGLPAAAHQSGAWTQRLRDHVHRLELDAASTRMALQETL